MTEEPMVERLEPYETPAELLTDLDAVSHHIEASDWPNKPLCRALLSQLREAQERADEAEGERARLEAGWATATHQRDVAEGERDALGMAEAQLSARLTVRDGQLAASKRTVSEQKEVIERYKAGLEKYAALGGPIRFAALAALAPNTEEGNNDA